MERCSHFGKYEEHKVINSKTNANGRSHWQITDAVIFSEEKKKGYLFMDSIAAAT